MTRATPGYFFANYLFKYACLWVFWQSPCMTTVLHVVWLQDLLELLGQRPNVPLAVHLQIPTLQLLEASLEILQSAYSREQLYRPVWISVEGLQTPADTEVCTSLLFCDVFSSFGEQESNVSWWCPLNFITRLFKILQMDIVWLLAFGKLSQQWNKPPIQSL